ncbi:hypothetical protein ACFRMQ_27740 [Kitasatospora sp. NPDC056783]|uniref:hypothetical protein n=1 Tax=Kitasatospora sp. NPDC056783 TaxID=3345943 RepID=UPI0036C386B5
MSGQYPGQFGPPPGGTPYGPGHLPGPVAGVVAGPAPIPGRFGLTARVLCALAPVLTFGLLGAVPSLLLALRRRRAYDVVGAVVFCALLLTLFVSAGVAGSLQNPTADTTGSITMAVLWIVPTAHFLVMDSRAVWLAGRPAPQGVPQAAPEGVPQAVPPYAVPNGSPYAATAPGYGVPGPGPVPVPAPAPFVRPAAAPAPETAHDLRELGELLRRQAREDQP